jgi:hypothetical protein
MSRFLKSFYLFVFPILLISGSIEFLIRNIPNDYSYKRGYLDKNGADIKILFLGSSHAYRDINPAYIDAKSFNAAYVSQSLYYDYRILEKYSDSLVHLKYIVIPVSYFSLFYELEDSPEAWRIKNYSIYYSMKTTYHIADYSELLSNRLDVNLGRIFAYYVDGQTGITTSEFGWGARGKSNVKLDLAKEGKITAQRHTVTSDAFLDKNVNVLKSIISFANKHNAWVIFYTPPAFKTYVENLNEQQLYRTMQTMEELDAAYSNVIYVNFLTSNLFDQEDFYDADHLNEIGSRKFTLEIEKLIDSQE